MIRGWRRFRGWTDVDILAGLGIAELLSSFFLDGLLVALQSLNLPGELFVFLLHLIDLLPQRFVFGAFVLVDDHSIRAEHDMNEQGYGQNCNGHGSDATAQAVNTDGERADFQAPRLGERLRLRRMLDHGSQTVFWPRKAPDFNDRFQRIHDTSVFATF